MPGVATTANQSHSLASVPESGEGEGAGEGQEQDGGAGGDSTSASASGAPGARSGSGAGSSSGTLRQAATADDQIMVDPATERNLATVVELKK